MSPVGRFSLIQIQTRNGDYLYFSIIPDEKMDVRSGPSTAC